MTRARTDEGSAKRSRALLLAVIVGVAIGGRASTARADETTAEPPAANDQAAAERRHSQYDVFDHWQRHPRVARQLRQYF